MSNSATLPRRERKKGKGKARNKRVLRVSSFEFRQIQPFEVFVYNVGADPPLSPIATPYTTIRLARSLLITVSIGGQKIVVGYP
jgi:hypothetical protein